MSAGGRVVPSKMQAPFTCIIVELIVAFHVDTIRRHSKEMFPVKFKHYFTNLSRLNLKFYMNQSKE